MATDLLLPRGLAPSNLHLSPTVNTRYIDSDLYDIAGRLKELDERLFIVELEEFGKILYAIMEHCPDGLERLVFRCESLDGRVLDKLRELMSVDLHTRLDRLEKLEHKWEADREEDLHEKLYETIGGPMQTELERCGFVQRAVSYPAWGTVGGKGSLRKG